MIRPEIRAEFTVAEAIRGGKIVFYTKNRARNFADK
jgi:hypothetical protein